MTAGPRKDAQAWRAEQQRHSWSRCATLGRPITPTFFILLYPLYLPSRARRACRRPQPHSPISIIRHQTATVPRCSVTTFRFPVNTIATTPQPQRWRQHGTGTSSFRRFQGPTSVIWLLVSFFKASDAHPRKQHRRLPALPGVSDVVLSQHSTAQQARSTRAGEADFWTHVVLCCVLKLGHTYPAQPTPSSMRCPVGTHRRHLPAKIAAPDDLLQCRCEVPL
jgi:hypothetical protein